MSSRPAADAEIATRLARAFEASEESAIQAAYLFGSFAENRAHRESDVDVAVLLDRRLDAADRFQVRLRLSSILPAAAGGRAVDVVVLNDAPPHLGRRAVLDGVRVFCRDSEADHAFRRDVQLRAADLEPFLRWTRELKIEALRR